MVLKCPAINLYPRSVQVLEQWLFAILDLATAAQFPDITPHLLVATRIQRVPYPNLACSSPGQAFSTGIPTTCSSSKHIPVTVYNPARNLCIDSHFDPLPHATCSNNAQGSIVHALCLLVGSLVDCTSEGSKVGSMVGGLEYCVGGCQSGSLGMLFASRLVEVQR